MAEKEVCKFHVYGHCTRGKDCHFSHDIPEGEPPPKAPSELPWFAKGSTRTPPERSAKPPALEDDMAALSLNGAEATEHFGQTEAIGDMAERPEDEWHAPMREPVVNYGNQGLDEEGAHWFAQQTVVAEVEMHPELAEPSEEEMLWMEQMCEAATMDGLNASAPTFTPSTSTFNPSAAEFNPSAAEFTPSARAFGSYGEVFEPHGFDPNAAHFNAQAPAFDPSAPAFDPSAPAFDPSAPAFDPNAVEFHSAGMHMDGQENDQDQICRHHLQGKCIFGAKCRYKHAVVEVREEDRMECGICFDDVTSRGQRFGVLDGCDHVFCLDCIRSWRKMQEQDRENRRRCPNCRNESYFVMPCDSFPSGEEKEAQLERYKEEMGKIPCKLFDPERPDSCPFGSSCFYLHLDKDGQKHEPGPLKWRHGASGSHVARDVKLSDFLFREDGNRFL